jgi:hypothetical protein
VEFAPEIVAEPAGAGATTVCAGGLTYAHQKNKNAAERTTAKMVLRFIKKAP